MEISVDKLAQEAINQINKKIKNLKHLNIIIVGKTGVGKSTLINSVFRENLAATGIGKPVTEEVRAISKPDFPLTIYDTPGFDLGAHKQEDLLKEITTLIQQGVSSHDINKMIHCMWYCINTSSSRVEQEEIDWIRNFAKENKITEVPIIVILTQAVPKKDANAMKDYIEAQNLDIARVVPLLATDKDYDEEFVYQAYGCDTLIEVMMDTLDKELLDTLQNVQIASLESKKKYSEGIIAAAVAASFGEGFAPIPFSDAALLVPTQVGMIAGITAVFGIDISKSFLTAFVSSTIGGAGATVLGRTIVANILKLIPGFGTGVGGAISGATAGLITTALGMAYIKIMEMVYKGELTKEQLMGEEGKDKMKRIFKDELKKKK